MASVPPVRYIFPCRVLYGFSARACERQAMCNACHRQRRATIVAQMTYLKVGTQVHKNHPLLHCGGASQPPCPQRSHKCTTWLDLLTHWEFRLNETCTILQLNKTKIKRFMRHRSCVFFFFFCSQAFSYVKCEIAFMPLS